MKNYPHIAARLFNTPLLVHPRKLDAIIAGLGTRLIGETTDTPSAAATAAAHLTDRLHHHHPHHLQHPPHLQRIDAHLDAHLDTHIPADLFTTARGEWRYDRDDGTGYTVHDDVAIVSAIGVLAHRTRLNADSSTVIGYQQIVRDTAAAINDPDIRAILLLLDTPGGEVAGAFEAAAALRELGATRKPIIAQIDTMAASAGYLLASAARERIITPTGYAGSIGVVMQHVDVSRAMANDGIGVTHIYAGDHKIDGNPYAPLSPSVRAEFQAEIDNLYNQFVHTVAANIGVNPDALRATQARTYSARAALDHRLVDRIGTTDETLTQLLAQRARTVSIGQPARLTVSPKEISMTDITTQPAGDHPQPAKIYTQADMDTAIQRANHNMAAHEKSLAEALAKGIAEGKQAEQDRVSAILAHADEAGSNPSAARVAIAQNLTLEQARAILDVAPAPKAAAHVLPSLATAGSHDLGPDLSADDSINTPEAVAKQILAVYHGTRQ